MNKGGSSHISLRWFSQKAYTGPHAKLLNSPRKHQLQLIAKPHAHPIPPTCQTCNAPGFSTRTFTSGAQLLKKGGKASRAQAEVETRSSDGGSTPDPFDFSSLQSGIDKAHTQLKEELSKLRAGGRFNPETLENLRVNVVKGSKDTERVADLAQVVPRGRVLNIVVGDRDVGVSASRTLARSTYADTKTEKHVKSILSAIQASDLNLTPQPDPQNPSQLNINLPPPTSDSRRVAVQTANKSAEAANTAIKNARSAQQKTLRSMQLSGGVRPDDQKKATTRMEKVVQDGSAEVKKIFESAKKVLESG